MLNLENKETRIVRAFRNIYYDGRKIVSKSCSYNMTFNREGANIFDNEGDEFEFRYKPNQIATFHVNDVFDEFVERVERDESDLTLEILN